MILWVEINFNNIIFRLVKLTYDYECKSLAISNQAKLFSICCTSGSIPIYCIKFYNLKKIISYYYILIYTYIPCCQNINELNSPSICIFDLSSEIYIPLQ